MAEHGLIKKIAAVSSRLLVFVAIVSLAACAAQKNATRPNEQLIKENIPRSPAWTTETKPPSNEPTLPAFASLTEDIVPLKTKIVNIVVRNSTLGDVLHVMAEASGLNLMIDRDVALDQPVTLSLKNTLAEDALKTIFSNLDCFYTIENNVLKVEAVGSRIFELGHPALVNTYSMDIGGNISGAGMKGAITSGSKADSKAHDFWGTMETSLASIVDKKDASPPLAGAANGTGRLAVQAQQSVTINRLTGTIMVTASRKNMDKVERYLENVRKVLGRQVMIEARIIEVQLNDDLQFGIDWTVLTKKALGVSALTSGFGALNFATTTLESASNAAAGTSKFQMGVSGADFQALLTALQTQGDIKTLSNPKINVMNGHASILTVGTDTSYISKVTATTTNSGSNSTVSFTPETGSVLSGLIIGIVPYISETGEITLNITPITSDLIDLKDKTFGSSGNQTTITIPTVALREMTTTVKMRDAQTVIIGGLISNKESSNEEKVPVLGNIPYLGRLFTRTNNTAKKTELVLLLRPRIIDNE
jgi:MSHA type pilus biogenesis protein MshL